MKLVKGHGTQNDFLVLPDLNGSSHLSPATVRALCDRRAGLGADGVLRVVRTAAEPDAAAFAPGAEYFMDYRNADGSVAEMCGNGIRVLFAYLRRAGLVGEGAAVATRGGIRSVRSSGGGNVSVQMGSPRFLADRPIVTAAHSSPVQGVALRMPNPHVVLTLPDDEALRALDLTRAPAVAPALPDGQNVEYVVRVGPRHLRMRVHERGVGETRSCGTGICAAAVAVAREDGAGADGSVWQVDVPGGTCEVRWDASDVVLSGPAVLVADVEVDDQWLAAAASADADADGADADGADADGANESPSRVTMVST